MTLDVEIRHVQGTFALDVRLRTDARLVALFGRSGAGKTSLVRLIAGLARPDAGRIALGDAVWVDTARGVFVPAHRRRIGYVFQDGRLFPHLSVAGNLGYGRWFARRRGGPAADVDEIVTLLGLRELLDRRPDGLSGGEKQRVAIGRALLARPNLLLMDEPLASLDEARKDEILPYLERLRDVTRVPIVYVSHSIPEVVRLAEAVALMSAGRVIAVGATGEVMGRTDLFPMTGRAEAGALIETHVVHHDARTQLTTLHSGAGPLCVPWLDAAPGTPLRVRIRARDVMIATRRPEGLSALNVIPGRIEAIAVESAPVVDVRIACGTERLVARITRHSVEQLGLAVGVEVYAVIKSVAFDRRATGAGLHGAHP